MNILFEKEAVKHIERLDKAEKQRIRDAIYKLPSGDVKKLQGYRDEYRLRVGGFRIIFYMDVGTIIIRDILPRGDVYKRM